MWFAANVILSKIKRQQRIDDQVNVSEIILIEYDKCKE